MYIIRSIITKNVLTLLRIFQHCSGLKINIEKTQSKYLDSLKNNAYFPHGLSWIKEPLETLGIIFTETTEQNYIHNFQTKLLILKSTLNIWKQCNLSIKGKISSKYPSTIATNICFKCNINTNKSFKEIDEITGFYME